MINHAGTSWHSHINNAAPQTKQMTQEPPAYTEATSQPQNGITTFSHYTHTTTQIIRKSLKNVQRNQKVSRSGWIFPIIYSIFIVIALLMVTLGSVSYGVKDIYIVRFDIGYTQFQVPENISNESSQEPIFMGSNGALPDDYEYVSGYNLGFHEYYQVGIFNWLQYYLQPTKTTKISNLEGINLSKTLNENSERHINVPGFNYKPKSHPKLNSMNNAFKVLQPISIMALVGFVVWWFSVIADASGRFKYVPCGCLVWFLLICHLIYAICYTIAAIGYANEIRSQVRSTLVRSGTTGMGLLWASFVFQIIAGVFHNAKNISLSQLGTDVPHHVHHLQD